MRKKTAHSRKTPPGATQQTKGDATSAALSERTQILIEQRATNHLQKAREPQRHQWSSVRLENGETTSYTTVKKKERTGSHKPRTKAHVCSLYDTAKTRTKITNATVCCVRCRPGAHLFECLYLPRYNTVRRELQQSRIKYKPP